MIKSIVANNGDSFKQAMAFEKTRTMSLRNDVVKKSVDKATAILSKDFGQIECRLVEDKLIETSAEQFSGILRTRVTINTEAGIKAIPFHIKVENSEPIFNLEVIPLQVKEQLSVTRGSIEKTLADRKAELLAHIDGVVKVAEGKVDTSIETIKKEAEEFRMGDEHIVSPQIGPIVKTFSYPKGNLPRMSIGDVINLNSMRYEIIGSTGALSTGENDGTSWVLKLIED